MLVQLFFFSLFDLNTYSKVTTMNESSRNSFVHNSHTSEMHTLNILTKRKLLFDVVVQR